jgi:hypothetical protein
MTYNQDRHGQSDMIDEQNQSSRHSISAAYYAAASAFSTLSASKIISSRIKARIEFLILLVSLESILIMLLIITQNINWGIVGIMIAGISVIFSIIQLVQNYRIRSSMRNTLVSSIKDLKKIGGALPISEHGDDLSNENLRIQVRIIQNHLDLLDKIIHEKL